MTMLHSIETAPLLPLPVRPLRRILSLDDETVDQMICQRMIARSALAEELVTFFKPPDALAYFDSKDSKPIDLVLLDVNMPVMDGFEFLATLQQRIAPCCIPPVLMMLTVPLGQVHLEQAKGFDTIRGYLNKPLSLPDLQSALALIQMEDEHR